MRIFEEMRIMCEKIDPQILYDPIYDPIYDLCSDFICHIFLCAFKQVKICKNFFTKTCKCVKKNLQKLKFAN